MKILEEEAEEEGGGAGGVSRGGKLVQKRVGKVGRYGVGEKGEGKGKWRRGGCEV